MMAPALCLGQVGAAVALAFAGTVFCMLYSVGCESVAFR